MVGFGLDYACTHIIIPASVNLLPIQADFVTERGMYKEVLCVLGRQCSGYCTVIGLNISVCLSAYVRTKFFDTDCTTIYHILTHVVMV